MLFKKIATSAAVLALTATVMTGCGSSKMSTEETCTYINDQAKEKGLKEKMQAAGTKMLSGDTEGLKSSVGEFTSLMEHAAAKTEDSKLTDALNASVEQTNKMVDLMSDDSLDLQEKSTKIQELDTAETKEKTAYLDTACPDIDPFG